jgi:P-type Cu+ transporter
MIASQVGNANSGANSGAKSGDELRYCRLCQKEVARKSTSDYCCAGCERVAALMQSSGTPVDLDSGGDWQAQEVAIAGTPPISYYVEGVHCSSCVWILERLPHLYPEQIARATLNLGQSILELQLRPGAKFTDVIAYIEKLGYQAHRVKTGSEAQRFEDAENRNRLIDVGVAGALAGNVMLMSIPLYSGVSGPMQVFFEWLSLALAIPSVFYSGRSFFTNVAAGFRTRTFPIDGPILLAILVALFYSAVSVVSGTHELYFDSLTTLVFLLLSSRYYLSRLRKASNRSLGILDHFQGNTQVQVGQRVAIQAHERIGYDGILKQGTAFLDLSHFSGESVPVQIRVGGLIFAGARVIECSQDAQVEVTAVGEDTRMASLLKKVRESQELKSLTELQSDRWAKRLLMVVSVVALAVMIGFASMGLWAEGLRRVLTLLIVTCPCALALATPLTFAIAIRKLLREGLLIKNPQALDELIHIRKIYFDKTGTITWGKLTPVSNLSGLPVETLKKVYSMVTRSRHPVSRALEYAIDRDSPVSTQGPSAELTHFEEIPGLGLRAVMDGTQYELIRAAESQSGNTELVFQKADGGPKQEVLRFAFKDQIRSTSARTVRELKQMGIEVALLSGDQAAPAHEIAQQCGIDEVYSEQSPEQKGERVLGCMMVGDGLNDALALSRAKVSVAVQGGIDAAIQSSQVYSLVPGIETIPGLIRMSHRLNLALRQNFVFSTSYNVVGGILAITGVMNPLIAAVLMPLSATTVFVATLIRFREPKKQQEAACTV